MIDAGVLVADISTEVILGIGIALLLVAAVTLVMFVGAWLWWNFKKRVIDPIWEKHYNPWSNRRHDRRMEKRAIDEAGRRAREE